MMKQFAAVALFIAAINVFAATDEYKLTIKNHAFDPKELKVPAGTKFKIVVLNEDATPAEFESKPLGREKVIPGKAKAVINLGPLKPGRYGIP